VQARRKGMRDRFSRREERSGCCKITHYASSKDRRGIGQREPEKLELVSGDNDVAPSKVKERIE